MDTADRKFCVCEFPDDEHFTNLEALIVQLGPKECLIPQGDGSPEQAALKKVWLQTLFSGDSAISSRS